MLLRPPTQRVSPRVMVLWALEYLVGWGVITGVAWGLVALLGDSPWGLLGRPGWIPWALGCVGLVTAVLAPWWRYRVHRWEVLQDVLYVRTGWFTRHWLLVPVSRVQTVDAEQGWLERLLRLATLRVSTASHLGSSRLAGLPVRTAVDLAAELAGRAHELRDDAT